MLIGIPIINHIPKEGLGIQTPQNNIFKYISSAYLHNIYMNNLVNFITRWVIL